MTINGNFVVLGKYIGSFSMSGSLTTTEEKKGRDGGKPKTEKTTKPATFTFGSSLRAGDRVTTICADDGQRFYLFERGGS